MNPLFKDILETTVYPALLGFAAIAWRMFLVWSRDKARAALAEASKRYAGAILVEAGSDPVVATQIADKMANDFEDLAKENMGKVLAKLGNPNDGAVATMIKGELGKLLAAQPK